MGLSFIRLPSHNVFDYRPRFYDPEKEEFHEKLDELRQSLGKEPIIKDGKEYKPGSTIRGSFRPKMKRRAYRERSYLVRLIVITMFLFLLAYLILIADLTPLVKLFTK